VEWLEKAAAQGDAGSQKDLGLMYLEGNGVAQNDKKPCFFLLLSKL